MVVRFVKHFLSGMAFAAVSIFLASSIMLSF